MDITISEVRSFIKAENLMPSDIFGIGDLTKDPMVEEHIEKQTEKVVHSEIERRRKINKGFDQTKEELVKEHEKTIEEKDKIITGLQGETIKSKTVEWLEAQKEKRELDEEQLKFITRNIPKFKPEDHEKAEDEFNKFLDGQIDELKGIKTDVFGEKPEEKKEKLPGGEVKGEKKPGDEVIEDMSLED